MSFNPSFIQRTEEIERLISIFKDEVISRKTCASVYLSGRLGVGKTRLIHEFIERVLVDNSIMTSIPNFNISPWILGAPHIWLAELISRISFLISGSMRFLPGFPRLLFQRQNNLNPLRCQRITVSGFTMLRACLQLFRNLEITTSITR